MNILNKSIRCALIIAFTGVFLPITAQSEELPVSGPFEGGRIMATVTAQDMTMPGAADDPAFSRFGTDGDGLFKPAALETAQMGNRRGMGMGQGRGKGMGRGMGRNMPSFSDYDLDGNGQIAEHEFKEAWDKRVREMSQQGYQMRNLRNAPSFGDIDADGDGRISSEEFTEHQSRYRQQRTQ